MFKGNKNINVTNCTIDNHHMGIYISNVNRANISNNNIKNTNHNAIAVQSRNTKVTNNKHDGSIHYFSGYIKIENNKIENAGDRAIRFGVGKNAYIEILNNTFINSIDTSNNQFIKTQGMSGCNLIYEDNKYYSSTNQLIDVERVESTVTVTTAESTDDINGKQIVYQLKVD